MHSRDEYIIMRPCRGAKCNKRTPIERIKNRKVGDRAVAEWLIGKQRHTIDDKNRVFIPSKFLKKLGSRIFVTKSLTGNCIRIYSLEGFDGYVADTLSRLPKVKAGEMLSWLGSNSEELQADSQGRIALPGEYRDFAGLEKNVVSSGAFDHVELWDEATFDKQDVGMDVGGIRALLESREDT